VSGLTAVLSAYFALRLSLCGVLGRDCWARVARCVGSIQLRVVARCIPGAAVSPTSSPNWRHTQGYGDYP